MWAQHFSGDSGSAGYTEDLAATSMAHLGYAPGNNAVANDRGSMEVNVLDYANTTGLKSAHATGYARLSTSSTGLRTWHSGGTWRSTAAINQITILPLTGTNFKSGSRATLYGLT